jgi:multidrug resistance efflux pump
MAAVNVANSQVATTRLTYVNKQELRRQNIIGDYDLQTAANSYASAKASLAQAKGFFDISSSEFKLLPCDKSKQWCSRFYSLSCR